MMSWWQAQDHTQLVTACHPTWLHLYQFMLVACPRSISNSVTCRNGMEWTHQHHPYHPRMNNGVGGGPPVNTLGAIRLYIYIHVCVWRFNTSSSPTLVYSTFNRCRFISSPINIHRLRGRWDSKRWGDFGRGDSTRGVPSRTAEGLRAEICLGPGYLFQFLSAQKVWNSAEAIETACSIRTGVGGKRRRAWRSAQTSAVQWTSMNPWTLASQWIGDGRWIYR